MLYIGIPPFLQFTEYRQTTHKGLIVQDGHTWLCLNSIFDRVYRLWNSNIERKHKKGKGSGALTPEFSHGTGLHLSETGLHILEGFRWSILGLCLYYFPGAGLSIPLHIDYGVNYQEYSRNQHQYYERVIELTHHGSAKSTGSQ